MRDVVRSAQFSPFIVCLYNLRANSNFQSNYSPPSKPPPEIKGRLLNFPPSTGGLRGVGWVVTPFLAFLPMNCSGQNDIEHLESRLQPGFALNYRLKPRLRRSMDRFLVFNILLTTTLFANESCFLARIRGILHSLRSFAMTCFRCVIHIY